MHNQFDVSNYYDVKTNTFIAREAEADAVGELRCMESSIIHELNKMLGVLPSDYLASKCQDIRIILEPNKEKLSRYSTILQVINEFKKYNSNHSDEFARKCLDELKRIKKAKWNKASGDFIEFYDRFKREHIEDKEARDVIEVTDLWLNPRLVAGEFWEKSNKKEGIKAPAIVLYLKTICNNANYNDYLIEVFAHELFHAYHWLSCDKKSRSSWNYNEFQIDTVKEGLASYFEYEFTRGFNIKLADDLKDDLAKHSMKHYPYSSFNIIERSGLFRELFEVSLYDFGIAYNKLLELYLPQDHVFDYLVNKYELESKALIDCLNTDFFPVEQKERLRKLIDEKGKICCSDEVVETNIKNQGQNGKPFGTISFITKELESNINNVKNVNSFRDLVDKYVARNYEEQKRGAAQFDSGIYKPLNISRKTFYNNLDNPRKDFAIACALMLKLNLNEAIKLIERAGYKLLDKRTSGNERDYIIYWAIDDGKADIADINELLEEKHQRPLYSQNAIKVYKQRPLDE